MAPNKISQIPERFLTDIRSIIEHGRQTAYAAAGQAAIMTYWNVGQRIVEEEQDGKVRAEYGKQIIPLLAEQLTTDYGTGYGRRNLAYYCQSYLTFPQKEILHEVVQNLTWTHIRSILSVSNPDARMWYMRAAPNSDEFVTCFRDGEVVLRSEKRTEGFTLYNKINVSTL